MCCCSLLCIQLFNPRVNALLRTLYTPLLPTPPSTHLETLCSCCERPCLVQPLCVVAQHEVEQPVVALIVAAVLLHTQLLQVARALLVAVLALPAAVVLLVVVSVCVFWWQSAKNTWKSEQAPTGNSTVLSAAVERPTCLKPM